MSRLFLSGGRESLIKVLGGGLKEMVEKIFYIQTINSEGLLKTLNTASMKIRKSLRLTRICEDAATAVRCTGVPRMSEICNLTQQNGTEGQQP